MGKKKITISPEEAKLAEIQEKKSAIFKSIKVNIKAKNDKQKLYWKNLRDTNKQIVIGSGSPGTGKSYLSLAYALKALKDGDTDRIIIVAPTCPAGGKDLDLGFLKGDMQTKLAPYQDADTFTMEKILLNGGTENPTDVLNYLIKEGYIKWELVNFLLGKTFDRSLLLVNEAEQYTKENMRLILTRIGEYSKFVISGDARQVNRKSIINKNDECGLTYICDKFKGFEEVSITEFNDSDIVRNPLITKILKVFDE